jgi:hypothetical protein
VHDKAFKGEGVRRTTKSFGCRTFTPLTARSRKL